jgi:Ca-activated chloride channel homolog
MVCVAAAALVAAIVPAVPETAGAAETSRPAPVTLEHERTPVTQRALRSYEPTGTPVTGAADGARAPLLQPGGYLDEMVDQDVKYYAVDVPLGYTAYVSGTVVNKVKGLEAIDVRHVGGRGLFCQNDTGLSQVRSKVVTATVRWTAAGDGSDNCKKPGRQIFSVTRRGVGPPVPLELRVMAEPPVQDKGPAEGHIAEYTEPGGAPQQVVGGGSFSSATTLPGSGHFTDTIAAGEWVFYRVRLEWGRSLAFQARVGGGKGSVAVQTHLYNPIREELAQESWGVTDTEHIFSGGSSATFATRPVRYLNRSERQQEVADMLPGWYYIAVAAQDEDEIRTLAVDVVVAGTPEPGPVYAQNAQVGETPPRQQSTAPRASGSTIPLEGRDTADSKHGESTVFGGPARRLALASALILGAALATWVSRRRTLRRPQNPPRPQDPPPPNPWTTSE